ncbi:aromatic amino acid lyase [Streptomyces violaceus]|uniref:aromatic amino acid lyase n=1 Tax=Streptomyces violaceus TaxID=1936 RepID=UPI00399D71E0
MPLPRPSDDSRSPDTRVRDLPDRSTAPLERTSAEHSRVAAAQRTLAGLDGSRHVYGVTHGFGPLVDHPADPDQARQGTGLISHLATGQGDPLPPEVTVWTGTVHSPRRSPGRPGGPGPVSCRSPSPIPTRSPTPPTRTPVGPRRRDAHSLGGKP